MQSLAGEYEDLDVKFERCLGNKNLQTLEWPNKSAAVTASDVTASDSGQSGAVLQDTPK